MSEPERAGAFRWTEAEVAQALGLAEVTSEVRVFRRVSTDTRTLGVGDLFVALGGARFDAHDFLGCAADAGASGAVVERVPPGAPRALRYFVVRDTLTALQSLARHRRVRSCARVVGVVGSNGKTTTKELIRAALTPRYRTHATEGNQNNQVGVPLTILSAPDDAEIWVVEMGTNQPGEIERLTDIVQPDAAVITAIGEEHLEKLETMDGVLEEETAILRGLRAGGLALVAEEPRALAERARLAVGRQHVRVAGFSDAANLSPDGGWGGVDIQPDGTSRWRWRGISVHLRLPGRWNVRNALLALGAAEAWGVDAAQAVRGVERASAPPLRGEWRRIGGLHVLADCYNANPPSVCAAIELLATLPSSAGPKVAVLGTMRELGAESDALHERCAAMIAPLASRELDLLVATGAFARAFEPFAAALGERLVTCGDPIEAYDLVRSRLRRDGMLLLKASRGEARERWLPLLERDFAAIG